MTWLAGRYQELTERQQKRVLEIRSHSPGGAAHARTPSAVAELQSGMEIFLEFGLDAGAIRHGSSTLPNISLESSRPPGTPGTPACSRGAGGKRSSSTA